jgi:hypothetical protein
MFDFKIILLQKCVSMIKKSAETNKQLDELMVSYSSPIESSYHNLSQTEVTITNNFANDMNKAISIGSASFTNLQGQMSIAGSDSFCEIARKSLGNSGSINCKTMNLIQKSAISQVAVVGENGRDCNVASSKTLTISFFQSSNKKLNVANLIKPISLWIPRVSNVGVSPYQTIPASSLSSTKCLYDDVFLQNSITLNGNNSIHLQFRPSSEKTPGFKMSRL